MRILRRIKGIEEDFDVSQTYIDVFVNANSGNGNKPKILSRSEHARLFGAEVGVNIERLSFNDRLWFGKWIQSLKSYAKKKIERVMNMYLATVPMNCSEAERISLGVDDYSDDEQLMVLYNKEWKDELTRKLVQFDEGKRRSRAHGYSESLHVGGKSANKNKLRPKVTEKQMASGVLGHERMMGVIYDELERRAKKILCDDCRGKMLGSIKEERKLLERN